MAGTASKSERNAGDYYKHIPICETYPLDKDELRDKME